MAARHGLPATPSHPVQRERLRPQASYCYLLDVDDDLAQEFDLRMRVVARQVATVVVFEIPIGEHVPAEWLEPQHRRAGPARARRRPRRRRPGRRPDGHRAHGRRRPAAAPSAGGDDLLEHHESWHVLVPARVAVLDAGFAERVRPWPQIALALLRRAGKRAEDLDVQRAIACQPRLEVRLALMLWHLAARWGKVEPGGIRLSLPLTHRLLGQLVGAERPSVSHALARLAEAELVTGRGDEWHLHGSLEHHLACFAERGHPVAPDTAAAVRATARA